jgi:hypothetical protein
MNYNSKFVISANNFTSSFPDGITSNINMLDNKIINMKDPVDL